MVEKSGRKDELLVKMFSPPSLTRKEGRKEKGEGRKKEEEGKN